MRPNHLTTPWRVALCRATHTQLRPSCVCLSIRVRRGLASCCTTCKVLICCTQTLTLHMQIHAGEPGFPTSKKSVDPVRVVQKPATKHRIFQPVSQFLHRRPAHTNRTRKQQRDTYHDADQHTTTHRSSSAATYTAFHTLVLYLYRYTWHACVHHGATLCPAPFQKKKIGTPTKIVKQRRNRHTETQTQAAHTRNIHEKPTHPRCACVRRRSQKQKIKPYRASQSNQIENQMESPPRINQNPSLFLLLQSSPAKTKKTQ